MSPFLMKQRNYKTILPSSRHTITITGRLSFWTFSNPDFYSYYLKLGIILIVYILLGMYREAKHKYRVIHSLK